MMGKDTVLFILHVLQDTIEIENCGSVEKRKKSSLTLRYLTLFLPFLTVAITQLLLA